MHKPFVSKEELRNLILNGESVSHLDYSHITDMSYMFRGCDTLDSVGDLDVKYVTNMEGMFYGCSSFNQNINHWNVSSVKDMSNMFRDCTIFNQPLNNWNVSNVKNMNYMFSSCSNFNQNINEWDVSNVLRMRFMFFNALCFNQPLNDWKLKKNVSLEGMFYVNPNSIEILNDIKLTYRKYRAITIKEDTLLGFYGLSLDTIFNWKSFDQSLENWDIKSFGNIDNLFSSGKQFINTFNSEIIIDYFIKNNLFNQFEIKAFTHTSSSAVTIAKLIFIIENLLLKDIK